MGIRGRDGGVCEGKYIVNNIVVSSMVTDDY